jgi:hypothetical protein
MRSITLCTSSTLRPDLPLAALAAEFGWLSLCSGWSNITNGFFLTTTSSSSLSTTNPATGVIFARLLNPNFRELVDVFSSDGLAAPVIQCLERCQEEGEGGGGEGNAGERKGSGLTVRRGY